MLTAIKRIIVLPLVALYWITDQKGIIQADVQRWVMIQQCEEKNSISQLITMLIRNKHFRNLFYFRLSKGSFTDRVLASVAEYIYRPRSGLRIRPQCAIGPGLFIQHGYETGFNATIGRNYWINQHVTVGYLDDMGKPEIGDNVRVGVGARVLGKIKIGDNVNIGANAVVVRDVPSNCTVVGVPAFIVRKDGKKVNIKL
jgi:serine O-acetyltransferase